MQTLKNICKKEIYKKVARSYQLTITIKQGAFTMCKLFFISEASHVKPEHRQALLNIMYRDQKDGLGVFSEEGYSKALSLKEMLYKPNYSFTVKPQVMTMGNPWGGHSLAIHSRTSTNKIDLMHTHPLIVDNCLFAHNGIVTVPKKHDFLLHTSNDSEYLANVVNKKPLKDMAKIQGYYAFINWNGTEWTIGKDDTAQLHIAKITSGKGGFIISTKMQDIIEAAKVLEIKIDNVEDILPFTLLTIVNGEIVNVGELPRSEIKMAKGELFQKSIGKTYQDDRAFYNGNTKLSKADMFDLGYEKGMSDAASGIIDSTHDYEDNDYWEGYEEGYNDTVYGKNNI